MFSKATHAMHTQANVRTAVTKLDAMQPPSVKAHADLARCNGDATTTTVRSAVSKRTVTHTEHCTFEEHLEILLLTASAQVEHSARALAHWLAEVEQRFRQRVEGRDALCNSHGSEVDGVWSVRGLIGARGGESLNAHTSTGLGFVTSCRALLLNKEHSLPSRSQPMAAPDVHLSQSRSPIGVPTDLHIASRVFIVNPDQSC